MTDIAATVAAMLKIQMPSGNIGKPLTPMMKKNSYRISILIFMALILQCVRNIVIDLIEEKRLTFCPKIIYE